MNKVFKKILPKKLKWQIRKKVMRFKSTGKQKIFGIGNNKTGTTSLETVMKELGFIVGNQITDIHFIREWGKKDFKNLIEYCKNGQFFQDIPFSKPFTFIVLDQAFPDSKFILTIRDNPDQWYNSLVKFHSNLWGKNGRVPTKEDLKSDDKFYEGYRWEKHRIFYNTPKHNIYKKDVLIESYKRHNKNVIEYFRHRPDDLLILNVANDGAYQKLCNFLNVEPVRESFPWRNKTEKVKK